MSKYLELFTSSFDESIQEKTKPENKPYVAYSIKEGKVAYTIVPKEDGTMYTVYRVVKKDISNCTYNMVDLGLPSGILWADRNVGATSPEHYGSYFQWGDTNAYTYDGAGEVTAAELAALLQPFVGDEMEVTKDNIDMLLEQSLGITGTDLTNVPVVGGLGFSLDKLFNWDSYFDTTDGGNTFNKYNNNGGLTVLKSSDDAATVNMGPQYRMPTIEEMNELINNTTQTFIDLDSNEYSQEEAQGAIEEGKLKGVRFTSSNGNSIFIPAAGNCYDLLQDIRCSGSVWSSSLFKYDDDDSGEYDQSSEYGADLHLYTGSIDTHGFVRSYGISVRGVQS